MTLWMQEVPQVPWTDKVKVAHILNEHSRELDAITLTKARVKVTVMSHGIVFINVNTKDNIGTYMQKDPLLTRSLLAYFRKNKTEPSKEIFNGVATDWVKGEPVEPPPVDRPGVLDWYPGIEILPKKIGKVGYYGAGKIKPNLENWIGSEFDYVHFVLPDPEASEGIAILWEGSSRPEVYVGDINGFVLANKEDFDDWTSYQSYNDLMENGLLWAIDEFGLFETDQLPDWVGDLVDHDPDLLWPDLVERLLPIRDLLPSNLRWALMTWVERRRQEAEEALGQLRFWHYPGKT